MRIRTAVIGTLWLNMLIVIPAYCLMNGKWLTAIAVFVLGLVGFQFLVSLLIRENSRG
jgi:hypothetical protein